LLRLAARLLPRETRDDVATELTYRYQSIRREQGSAAAARWAWRQPWAALVARVRWGRPVGSSADACHRRTWHSWLGEAAQDLRQGGRLLRKYPGFTLAAALTLALGVGANVVIFSVVDAVMLRQLPLPFADRTVMIRRGTGSSLPYPEFLDLAAHVHSLDLFALNRREDVTLTVGGDAERASVRMVSPDFFPMTGLGPLAGRTFTRGDDALSAEPVVVLTEPLWRRRFGANREVIGSRVVVGSESCTVVGVVPALPSIFAATDVFYPIGHWSEAEFRHRGNGFGTAGLARLRAGVSLTQAQQELNLLASNLAAAYPKEDKDLTVTAQLFRTVSLGSLPDTLELLMGAVVFVLLIACANVANLLLVRMTSRGRELALRIAVGASRARITRQVLAETLLLGGLGGLAGVALAAWGTRATLALAPAGLLGSGSPDINVRVLLFALGVTTAASVVFGLVPALRASRVDLVPALRDGGRGATSAAHHIRRLLVVGEVALALVLLAGAGLLVRSLSLAWHVDPGFDPRQVLIVDVALAPDAAGETTRMRSVYDQLLERLQQVPGADSAAVLSGNLPLTGESDISFWREDRPRPEPPADPPNAIWYAPTPAYAHVMGIPIRRGRFFTDQDVAGAPLVAVVNDVVATRVFPSEDPIGKRVFVDFFKQSVEIVGVVGSVKQFGLDASSSDNDQCQLYLPFAQVPDRLMPTLARNTSVVVRTVVPPESIIPAVRQQVRTTGPGQVMYGERTMEAQLDGSMAFRRFSMMLLTIFAGLALFLACVGVYGVMASLTGERSQEIGVRTALGASRRQILSHVVAQGARLVVIGVGLGLLAAWPLLRLLTSQLFGVKPSDPMTLFGVAAGLTLVAIGACYIPARRAARVDALVALRAK
jgi:predicted permease